jgi:branched-chain amino acid transport system ATP-binding protein
VLCELCGEAFTKRRFESKENIMATILEVRKLYKAFGGVKAVIDVSFSLEDGELLAMIGPNGAGKSTCFNLINGQ